MKIKYLKKNILIAIIIFFLYKENIWQSGERD